MSKVYDTYFKSFEAFRKTPEIRTAAENDEFCKKIKQALKENLNVIPNLATGVLECRDLVSAAELDAFMNSMLRSVCLTISAIRLESQESDDVLSS